MKAINPNEIKDNFIELIGKEWMLVSAGDKEKFNMMTASWGGVGVLWNRPVVLAFSLVGMMRRTAMRISFTLPRS